MACDICGNNKEALVPLLDSYKTEKVQQICPACEKILDQHLREIKDTTHNIMTSWLKRFIHVLKGSYSEKS